MSKPDLPDMVKWCEDQIVAAEELLAALQTQISSEPGHMEALLLHEKNMAEEDGLPMEEGELDAIMQAHKKGSPFALDVKAAEAKLMEAMKQ